MSWLTVMLLIALLCATHVLSYMWGRSARMRHLFQQLSQALKDAKELKMSYEEKVRSVADQLDSYAEHIESNYMDADESSVIRSCSNMLRELVKEDE